MLRKFSFALLALGIASVALLAEEYNGKVKSVDPDKNKIVITIPGKDGEKDMDKEFVVTDDTKFTKAGKGKGKTVDLADKLKEKVFTADTLPNVTIVTEKKGDKEVVTEVKVKGKGGKKKKADN